MAELIDQYPFVAALAALLLAGCAIHTHGVVVEDPLRLETQEGKTFRLVVGPENADFARMVTDAGVVFVGPPSSAIATLGDKIASKALAIRSGGRGSVPRRR